MSEPTRLIDVERGRALELLLAARDVAPAPPEAVERALQAVGTASAAAVPAWAVVKWLALGVAVGVTGSAVMVLSQRGPEPAAVAQRSPAGVTASAPWAPAPTFIASAPPTPSPSPALVVRPPSAKGSLPSASLADEVAELDRASALLARGSAERALFVLDQYDARFTRPQLGPEAQLLRVRALSAVGRAPAARELARRLLATNPSLEYAARVREAAALEAP
ncbi:MAG: hypothetical protein ABUL60_06540 [Myxococcales bacterium]